MIFGINNTRDISKLSQISLAERLVKLRITILKYHSWFLYQISLQIMLFINVILGGPFSRKGAPKRYLNLLVQSVPCQNERLLTLCRHFGTFWATEKAWARITEKSRMFVW